jgi:hypothetical protein
MVYHARFSDVPLGSAFYIVRDISNHGLRKEYLLILLPLNSDNECHSYG